MRKAKKNANESLEKLENKEDEFVDDDDEVFQENVAKTSKRKSSKKSGNKSTKKSSKKSRRQSVDDVKHVSQLEDLKSYTNKKKSKNSFDSSSTFYIWRFRAKKWNLDEIKRAIWI